MQVIITQYLTSNVKSRLTTLRTPDHPTDCRTLDDPDRRHLKFTSRSSAGLVRNSPSEYRASLYTKEKRQLIRVQYSIYVFQILYKCSEKKISIGQTNSYVWHKYFKRLLSSDNSMDNYMYILYLENIYIYLPVTKQNKYIYMLRITRVSK